MGGKALKTYTERKSTADFLRIGKHISDMQEMLHSKGINWNDYPIRFKRGGFIAKITEVIDMQVKSYDVLAGGGIGSRGTGTTRSRWTTLDIPIITEDREFLESRIPKI